MKDHTRPPVRERLYGVFITSCIVVAAVALLYAIRATTTLVSPTALQSPPAPQQPTLPFEPSTLRGLMLYTDPSVALERGNSKITSQPIARWLVDQAAPAGARAYLATAKTQGRTPILVAYYIPQRDCGDYSRGGAADATSYVAWIRTLADVVANQQAIIILEPDALAKMDCLSQAARSERLRLLSDATTILTGKPGVKLYIDAGHANWKPASHMAALLKESGVEQASGFALNVANFVSTAKNQAYGDKLAALLDGSPHYVIDTSRNGTELDPSASWCNPPQATLGQVPTTDPLHSHNDALLWIKNPGESDGSCNGGPAAGEWWQVRADSLSGKN